MNYSVSFDARFNSWIILSSRNSISFADSPIRMEFPLIHVWQILEGSTCRIISSSVQFSYLLEDCRYLYLELIQFLNIWAGSSKHSNSSVTFMKTENVTFSWAKHSLANKQKSIFWCYAESCEIELRDTLFDLRLRPPPPPLSAVRHIPHSWTNGDLLF